MERRDLPHAIPLLLRDALGIPVTTWTVRTPEQAEIASNGRTRSCSRALRLANGLGPHRQPSPRFRRVEARRKYETDKKVRALTPGAISGTGC